MDEIKKMAAGHSIEVLDQIMTEVETARGTYDTLDERLSNIDAETPSPSTAAPAMDGTAAAGTSTDYARADHIHPSDTSKQDALTTAQLDAVNSGIDSAKVEQIETNKNNILSIQADVAKISGQGNEIAVNSDLDQFNDVGTYYSGGATISATLSNCPTIQPFRLYVDFWQTNLNRIQRIVAVKDTANFEPIIFYRVKSSTGWKPWIKFEGSAVT